MNHTRVWTADTRPRHSLVRLMKGFLWFPSFYLQTERDYTEAGSDTLLHYHLHIKVDLERKPGTGRVSAAEMLFFIRHGPSPTCIPILSIALINRQDLLHPLLLSLSSRPHPFGAVPHSPPTIASPCNHSLSTSLVCPPRVEGSGNGDRICLSIDSTAVLLFGWPLSHWMVPGFMKTVNHRQG